MSESDRGNWSTGHVGRLVAENRLDRDVAAAEVVALARNSEKAPGLAARGVQA